MHPGSKKVKQKCTRDTKKSNKNAPEIPKSQTKIHPESKKAKQKCTRNQKRPTKTFSYEFPKPDASE